MWKPDRGETSQQAIVVENNLIVPLRVHPLKFDHNSFIILLKVSLNWMIHVIYNYVEVILTAP